MNKKVLLLVIITMILSSKVFANTLNTIIIKDDAQILFNENEQPVLKRNTLLVPAKKLLEEFGFEYVENNQSIIGIKDDKILTFPVNQRLIKVNNDFFMTPEENQFINDQLYVPLGTFVELNGHVLKQDTEGQSLTIDTINENNNEIEQSRYVIPKHFVELDGTKYTLEKIEDDLYQITNHYKGITSLEIIGESYEGRPLYVIKLGVPSEKKRPSILIISNIHGREDFSSMLNMKMMDYMLYSFYDTGKWGEYNIKDILTKLDIYLLPVANPDGLNIAHNGIKASRNYDFLKTITNVAGNDAWWKANGRGVDLNRNFDDGNWKIKNAGTDTKWYSSEGFKGESPNSEPETKAIQKFCESVKPLMAVSLHTSGNLFYWADTDTHSKFDGIDTEIMDRMHNLTGYRNMPISTNPKEFGSGFENWFKVRFYRFAFVAELSPMTSQRFIQHPDSKFEALVWNKAKFIAPQLALEALRYKDRFYDVYQGDRLLKTFYSKEKAIECAKKWKNSTIIKNDEIIWNFNSDNEAGETNTL
ncbi:M14 family zinc carboxypeptidase [Defluviitalea saccharophila]|uniref:M14 family zinc carboxypeptidase n=1 Tax=Defluviitalea saccharophila TaxID=879970 RepID=A0ABZ2Y687_9FIRM